MLSRHRKFMLLVVVGTLAIIAISFPDLLFSPHEVLIQVYGDGGKNYFTPAFYTQYDQGWWFTGMNYPYGEHVVFTDNQPVLSGLVNLVDEYIYPVAPYTFGIINGSMLVSLLIASLFLYMIARKMLLPPWYAAIIALIITFLAPQLLRMRGHYSLAYVCYIPLVWYGIIRFFESHSNTWGWSIYLMGILLFFSFLHVYYLMIGATFIITFLFVHLIQYKNEIAQNWSYYGKGGGILLVSIGIFYGLLQYTDPYVDRPAHPVGFLYFTAIFETVFLPVKGPFLKVWNWFIDVRSATHEGFAYVGFVGLLAWIGAFFKAVHYIYHQQWYKVIRPVLPASLPTAFWAALIILAFAMGYPFKLNLEFLLDELGLIQQFRSPGRFAWVFYYVFTLFTACYFYYIYRLLWMKRLKSFAFSMIALVLFSWGLSAAVHVNINRKFIEKQAISSAAWTGDRPRTDYNQFLQKKGYKPADFQAILPLPLYNLGAEIYTLKGNGKSKFESMRAAYQLGLPILANGLSRSSLSRSLNISQLLSGPLVQKNILSDLPSHAPFLLIADPSSNKPYETFIKKRSQRIGEWNNCTVYQTPLSVFAPRFDAVNYKRQKYMNGRSASDPIIRNGTGDQVLIQNYEQDSTLKPVWGKGIKQATSDTTLIMNKKWSAAADTYVVSIWVALKADYDKFPRFHVKISDENKKSVRHKVSSPKNKTIIYDNWVKMRHRFILNSERRHLKVWMQGGKYIMDSFLLRPADSKVYYALDQENYFMMNNFRIPKFSPATQFE